MKYSKLQYFLWLVSGCEINTLKECPEDYNRQANIGMMILITSLFACTTAYIAGKTFAPESSFGILLFSIVWGILIFALDRSMVNSIKRDPALSTHPFWPYFIPRLILALILAFFMSVPLDHIVFPEAIQRQLESNVQAKYMQRQRELNEANQVDRTQKELDRLQIDMAAITVSLKSDCPLQEYKQALADYNGSNQQLPYLTAIYNKKLAERKAHYQFLQRQQDTIYPVVDRKWMDLGAEAQTALNNLKAQRAKTDSLRIEASTIDRQWRDRQKRKYNASDSAHAKSDSTLKSNEKAVADSSESFKKMLQSMNGFDTKFETLFSIPEWGVQILKWAIFLALLVIEILPTYLKLKTPIGEYDIEINKKEKAYAARAVHFLSTEDKIAADSEKHREEKEVKLNKEIVDKMAEIELRLAKESLDEWEKGAKPGFE